MVVDAVAADKKAPAPTLEDEISFSWRNVFRRWGSNLKDDIDPALTGVKLGVYALHAAPTWNREFAEGKLRTEHPLISGATFLLTAGTELAAYYAGAQFVNEQFGHSIGYAAAGATMLASQGVSWIYEAFNNAKRTEYCDVIMTRIQRSFENGHGTYDLSIADLQQKVVDRIIADNRSERNGGHPRDTVVNDAREMIMDVAFDVFNGVVADGNLGKRYEMTNDLKTGPQRRRELSRRGRGYSSTVPRDVVARVIAEEVKTRGGSANIELFGRTTLVYGGKEHTHYQVQPNAKIWG